MSRIAIATSDRESIEGHFGRSKYFLVVDIDNKEVVNREYIEAPEHDREVFPKFLADNKVEVVIGKKLGHNARDIFASYNMEVISGIEDKVEDAIALYIDGKLVSKQGCCGKHHKHGCGSHKHEEGKKHSCK